MPRSALLSVCWPLHVLMCRCVLQKQLEQHNTCNRQLEEQLAHSKQQLAQQQVGAHSMVGTTHLAL